MGGGVESVVESLKINGRLACCSFLLFCPPLEALKNTRRRFQKEKNKDKKNTKPEKKDRLGTQEEGLEVQQQIETLAASSAGRRRCADQEKEKRPSAAGWLVVCQSDIGPCLENICHGHAAATATRTPGGQTSAKITQPPTLDLPPLHPLNRSLFFLFLFSIFAPCKSQRWISNR